MRVWRRRPWGIGAAAIAVLPSLLGCGTASLPGGVAQLGEVAPRFALPDVDGGTFSLQDAVAAKPLVLVLLPGCT